MTTSRRRDASKPKRAATSSDTTVVSRKGKRRSPSSSAKRRSLIHTHDASVKHYIDSDGYHKMFLALVESMNEAAIVVNRDLKVLAINTAARQLIGATEEDVIGVSCFKVYHSSRCGIGCPLAIAMQTGNEPPETEMQLLNNKNGISTVRVRVRLLRDEHNQIIGGIEFLRDVSADKHRETPPKHRDRFGPLIGRSKAMQQIYQLIEDISDSLATVLIYGETGTGKELVAQAIHQTSLRANGPFVKVNCGAIPETLLEAELFGYVRGAFTDAVTDKPGRFELAHGGTIFLDEIGEISPAVQVKLLRVLQEREFERLGGTKTIKVDVRIIAATNRDLREAVKRGHFREDLFYRLNVIPIHIPPLRERRDDIPLLVDHFVEKFRRDTGRPIEGVSPNTMHIFLNYNWPGNIRELENALEYAFVVCKGGYIQPHHLPVHIRQAVMEAGLRFPAQLEVEEADESNSNDTTKRNELLALLEVYDWDLDKCAQALNTSRSALYRRMRKWGINPIQRS
ncbi:MAG: sigma 54-interacting transcriptional regulator [Armatimonadota bacterium]|nr:sigma 54-interacting transcriptional regulator [Armatimonadota bacterium]MCX7777458.1 sigma 54-interacting transcriptional regulator [Armatimonadota bacterium]MDW8025534.1 sigma 54-interacting transcriptional regulator [Armatimonadota bacterium]